MPPTDFSSPIVKKTNGMKTYKYHLHEPINRKFYWCWIYDFLTQEPKDQIPPITRKELIPVRPAHYADTFVGIYVISVAAASVAEIATYPLDLTKTRLQIQGEAASSTGKAMVCWKIRITIISKIVKDTDTHETCIKSIFFASEKKLFRLKLKRKFITQNIILSVARFLGRQML